MSGISHHIEFQFGMIPFLEERIMLRDKTATLQYCSIPCSAAEFIISLYVSHFSSDWVEIRHDPFLRGKDHVERQNSDPAALQYFMQCCRIYNQPISQPFLIRLSWNLAWLVSRVKGSSLHWKNVTLQHCSIPCTAAESISSPYLSHFSSDWAAIWHD